MVQESELETAARRVADAERYVIRQRQLVARLGAHGHNTEEAERLLHTFETALDRFRQNLDLIRREP